MKGVRTRAVTLVFLLLVFPGLTQARPSSPPSQPMPSPPPAWHTRTEKLAPELQDALQSLAPGATLTVIIVLEEQANLRRVAGNSRDERLQAVVRQLQRAAQESQGELRALLSVRQSEGAAPRVIPYWIFNGLAVTARAHVIHELAGQPEVQRITLDEPFQAPTPLPEALLSSTGYEWNLGLVGAPAVWQLGLWGQGTVVASLDTGVSATHPDLVQQWRGGSNSWFDPYGQHPHVPTDLMGHGTWTMGVMVGRDASGTAVGMAPQARWIAVKIFDDAGRAFPSAIHQGFQWLLDPDGDPSTPDAPHVVNNSWSFLAPGCDLAFQLDLQALRAAGILPIFAAGNAGPAADTSVSPPNYPEAFAVGATNAVDEIYPDSSRGPSACGEEETIFPEMVAPGVGIRTTDRYGTYYYATGTSVAAPHVTGALALLLSANPNLTVEQQEAALLSGTVDLGPLGPDNTYGQGRLDVWASYHALPIPYRIYLPLVARPD
jgi:subtilisin family serine protease